MWKCPKCRERLDDGFDVCWNCGTSHDGVEDPEFERADDDADEADDDGSESAIESLPLAAVREATDQSEVSMRKAIKCRDCGVPVAFLGQIALMKQNDSVFWSVVAAFSNHNPMGLETFPVDFFRCPRCGRLEMYDLDLSLPGAQSS